MDPQVSASGAVRHDIGTLARVSDPMGSSFEKEAAEPVGGKRIEVIVVLAALGWRSKRCSDE